MKTLNPIIPQAMFKHVESTDWLYPVLFVMMDDPWDYFARNMHMRPIKTEIILLFSAKKNRGKF
jgi:hypothetical protein